MRAEGSSTLRFAHVECPLAARELSAAFHAVGALRTYGPTAMPLGCPNPVSEPLIFAIGATLPLLLGA